MKDKNTTYALLFFVVLFVAFVMPQIFIWFIAFCCVSVLGLIIYDAINDPNR